jgi:8-amino-7-oxononanoate synthase
MPDSRNWFRTTPEHLVRRFPECLRLDAIRIEVKGRRLINFASNDYLGLAFHPEVRRAARIHIDQHGLGSGASRLISGDAPELHELEAKLADWKDYEAALVVGSGYLANTGLIDALTDRHSVIFCDRLNHASLVDGARLSRGRVYRYAHGDMEQLADGLQRHGNKRKLIVSDGVFSMDGDCASVSELACLAEEFDALVLIDDAHGTGVLGPSGRGLLAEQSLAGHPRILEVGTLGKALGSYGAFILGSKEMIEGLKQRLRTLIYSTALPPCVAAGATSAIALVQNGDLPGKLQANIQYFVQKAARLDLPFRRSRTAIQPLVLGKEKAALAAAVSLRNAGFFVPAIRPPTVPEGTSRLRITLSAIHTKKQINTLLHALREDLQ